MMQTSRSSLDGAYASLRSVGVTFSPETAEIFVREDRFAVVLPDERIAWFPSTRDGRRRMAVERRALGLVRERCRSFQVPNIMFLSDNGFDIRRTVPGNCDPADLHRRCKATPALAEKIGRAIGAMLAEQHGRVKAGDVAGWLPQQVEWPEPADWILERLPRVVTDKALLPTLEATIARYEAVAVEPVDCVMVHGDIGFHNLAIDPATDVVNGIFDYDSAAWADRHHDFRYLLFFDGREAMLEAALAVYEPAVGRRLDRGRIHLYNAACAISYLAFRDGVTPHERWCGRTLAEDLEWTRTAIASVPPRLAAALER